MKDWTIKLPSFTAGENSLAEIIITILTDEWPLSSKGVHSRLRSHYGKSVSIQGVHKAIKKLHEEEILAKVDNYYKLNPDWLHRVQKFGSTVKNRYKNYKSRLKDLP